MMTRLERIQRVFSKTSRANFLQFGPVCGVLRNADSILPAALT